VSAGANSTSDLDRPNANLALLAPAFRACVEAALAACNDPTRVGGPLQAMVYEGYRSQALQAIYFQRGRTVKPPPRTVTNAPTNDTSWHGYGLAVDVVHQTKFWNPPNGDAWFEAVAEIFKANGCNWGGDWTQADLPHFQWGRCAASPSDNARAMLRDDGVTAVWAAVGAT
jgi:peptidoglycan L-alanyl-D-glutamate endopeptidase CwlK